MIKTKFDSEPVVNLADLSYEDVSELSVWCNGARNSDGRRYVAMQQRWSKEADRAKASRLRREAADAIYLPKLRKWLDKNLTAGDFLKMKGCRDGEGIRKFLSWTDNGTLECRQVRWTKGCMLYTAPLGQITIHMYDKVISVLQDHQWVSLRKFL